MRPTTLRRLLRSPVRPVLAGPVVAGLALSAMAMVGVLAPAAQADHVVERDATHDVRQTRDGRLGSLAAQGRREPDITRTRISYTDDRLRLKVRLRQLSATRNHASLVQIVTPGYTAGVYVTRIPSLGLESVTLIRGAGRVVDCTGLDYRMRFGKNLVKVVVPRSCLDNAAWVRVGFALSTTTSTRAFSDDALSPRLTGAAHLTRRLRAG